MLLRSAALIACWLGLLGGPGSPTQNSALGVGSQPHYFAAGVPVPSLLPGSSCAPVGANDYSPLRERWLDVLRGRAPHETALGLYAGRAYDWADLYFFLASWQTLYDYETIWGQRAPEGLHIRLEADLGVATGTEFSGERIMASGNFLAVYEFAVPQSSKFVPYVEAGIGLIYTDFQREGQAYRVNFNPVAGFGFRNRTTFVTLRLHHLSNGGLNDDNRGINSIVLGFGIYLGSER